MPMIRTCAARGCSTLTMGERCLEHEPPASDSATFPRGRPYQTVRSPSVSRAGTRSTRAVRVGQVIADVPGRAGAPGIGRPGRQSRGGLGHLPDHTNITATVFWIGEPVGNGSTENNAVSAYDDRWLEHYGGVDDHSMSAGTRTSRGSYPARTRSTSTSVRRLPRRRHPQAGRMRESRGPAPNRISSLLRRSGTARSH